MDCGVPDEQLWSWVDRNSPELERHLRVCPRCRKLAQSWRDDINALRVAPPPMRVPLPERIGPYRILGLLGEGGQGLVYHAEQQTPKRPVALKVLRGGRCVRDHELRNFRREVETLGALNHPGIATIYEAGSTDDGQHYFAMELVSGLPLGVWIRERHPTLPERLQLFAKLCDAVAYAHTQGVVHRDLKPGNIIVGADGDPRVLDFGLARLTNRDLTLTQSVTTTGSLVGTLRYMSPEQARGASGQIDERSDVYALGVILYELLTDRTPYDTGPSMTQAVLNICETAPRRPSSVVRTLRGDLEGVILKALEKEPAWRYASVAEMAADIRKYLAGEPLDVRRTGHLYHLRRKLRRHRATVGIMAACLLIAMGGVWMGMREHAANASSLQQDARRYALGVMRQIETGRVESCIAAANSFASDYPLAPERPWIGAKAYFRSSQLEHDAILFKSAISELDSTAVNADEVGANFQLLGEVFIESGRDRSRGESYLKQAQARKPRTAEGWYLRSLATLDQARQIEYAQQAVRLDPDHALAWERLALLYVDAGNEMAARAAAAHVKDIGRGVSGSIEVQAHVLLKNRRYQQADDEYTHGIAVNPYSRTCYRERALAHLCLEQHEQAVADYGNAIRLDLSSNYWINYCRATPLWILGRYEDARTDYDHVCQFGAKTSFAYARRFLVACDQARALAGEGRAQEAETLVSQAEAALDAARHAANDLWLDAVLSCLMGDISPEELVATADQSNAEAVCESFYYAGEACLLDGRLAEARDYFSRCVATNLVFDKQAFPPDPMNEYHLARWRLRTMDQPASRPAPLDGG